MKNSFLHLINDWRDYLSRGLQHFINMLLAPHPMVGSGKTKVKLIFNSPLMLDRMFTVEVKPKEKRGFDRNSSQHIKPLMDVVSRIN